MFWKKILISLSLLFISFNVFSQIHCYCDVIEYKGKVKVVFANNPPYISESYQETMLCDIETNKPIKFASAIECINHLSLYGWQVVSSTQTNYQSRYTLRNTLNSTYQIQGRLERDMRIMREYKKI